MTERVEITNIFMVVSKKHSGHRTWSPIIKTISTSLSEAIRHKTKLKNSAKSAEMFLVVRIKRDGVWSQGGPEYGVVRSIR